MTKLTLTILTASACALTSLHAEDKACCAKHASNAKTECGVNYASLKLTADQQKKLSALEKECMKSGCTEKSMAAFMKKAQGVLSKEQFAALKAECAKHPEHKA